MNHYLIFIDKSVIQVTEKEAEFIFSASAQTGSKGIRLKSGSWVNFNSLSKILTEDEYFQQYPDKRPEIFEEWKVPKQEYVSFEAQAEGSKIKLKGLLQGLKQYIDEELAKGITPKHAIKLYEDKLAVYKRKFAV